MAEYLDKTGLTYLWSKIKAKFDAKADKSALDAKADKTTVDALGKRIDNLILSSGTESSAEVVDARTGYDGTVYDTLGTSIRTQVSELKSDLVNSNTYSLKEYAKNGTLANVNLPLIVGQILSFNIGSSPVFNSQSDRLRTDYLFVNDIDKVTVVPRKLEQANNNFYFKVFLFDKYKNAISGGSYDKWCEDTKVIDVTDACFMIICIQCISGMTSQKLTMFVDGVIPTNEINPIWEIGAIYGTHLLDSYNTDRIRTDYFYREEPFFVVSNNFPVEIYKYNSDGEYVGVYPYNTGTRMCDGGYWYRMMGKSSDYNKGSFVHVIPCSDFNNFNLSNGFLYENAIYTDAIGSQGIANVGNYIYSFTGQGYVRKINKKTYEGTLLTLNGDFGHSNSATYNTDNSKIYVAKDENIVIECDMGLNIIREITLDKNISGIEWINSKFYILYADFSIGIYTNDFVSEKTIVLSKTISSEDYISQGFSTDGYCLYIPVTTDTPASYTDTMKTFIYDMNGVYIGERYSKYSEELEDITFDRSTNTYYFSYQTSSFGCRICELKNKTDWISDLDLFRATVSESNINFKFKFDGNHVFIGGFINVSETGNITRLLRSISPIEPMKVKNISMFDSINTTIIMTNTTGEGFKDKHVPINIDNVGTYMINDDYYVNPMV